MCDILIFQPVSVILTELMRFVTCLGCIQLSPSCNVAFLGIILWVDWVRERFTMTVYVASGISSPSDDGCCLV